MLAIFSKKLIRDALDPTLKSKKSAVERHHLYPKRFLNSLGFEKPRITNQIANYALIEWNDNVAISDTPPSDYFLKYWGRLKPKEQADQAYWHALPEGWEQYAGPLEISLDQALRACRDGDVDGLMDVAREAQARSARPGALLYVVAWLCDRSHGARPSLCEAVLTV